MDSTDRVQMAREIQEQTMRIDAYVQVIRYILKNRERLNREFAQDTDGLMGHLVDQYLTQADEVLTKVQVRTQQMLQDPRKEA